MLGFASPVALVTWWYRDVPKLLANQERLLMLTVIDYFSFGILLRTLFAPWKRDEISTERLSLQERLQILGLNVMSRLIGAVIRSGAIVVGLIALLAAAAFNLFLWATWLVAPWLGLLLVVIGIVTIIRGDA